MASLLDEPSNLLFFELMNEEMNTSFNVHAGIKIDQYRWTISEMRNISSLRRHKFKRALDELLSLRYLKKIEVTINTPAKVSKQTTYLFNADLQEEMLDKWRVLLSLYWQLKREVEGRPVISS